jgi:DNA-binding beta-propeller fold protein YncE
MRITRTLSLSAVTLAVALLVGVAPALAETHPFQFSFGTFSNPNGIAVDESTGDVYVADLGTGTVSKFDSSGALVTSWATDGVLDGSATPAGAFEFPSSERGTPAGIAVDNSKDPSDPSRGDLYVLDAGHEVIDKFNANGQALTPITGPFTYPPLGVGVDSSGSLHVDVRGPDANDLATEVFDDAAANGFVALISQKSQFSSGGTQEYGFATGGHATVDDYPVLSPCGCVAKLGSHGEQLGRVDTGSTAVAVAVDPVTGHVYVDDQSALTHSVSEWDTGEMNGPAETAPNVAEGTGTFVSGLGSLQLLGSPEHPEQGGIAVNGATGAVYVSSPADGEVYVFGSSAPVTVAGSTTDVTQTSATLQGTVDPRGVPIESCRFEYATSPSNDLTLPIVDLGQSVECVGEHGESVVGATSPVVVHADIGTSPGGPALEPGALYHFRLVASNTNGESHAGGLLPTAGAGFGIKQFEVSFLNQDGTPDVQAGSHPFEMVTNIVFNTQVTVKSLNDPVFLALPQGNVKDVSIHFPSGFYGDPNATAKKCTLQELTSGGLGDACPPESDVGTALAEHGGENEGVHPGIDLNRLLSIVPPRGVAFQLSAHIKKPNAFIDVGVPGGGDSGVVAVSDGIPVTVPVFRSTVTVFGVPPVGGVGPLLTLPSSCNGPLHSTIEADSYQEPSKKARAVSVAPGMSDCAPLVFPPVIETRPDVSNASSSSGLDVRVHVSQKAALNPTGLAESALRDTTVALPLGVAVNPSGGDGLEGCSEGLVGFQGFAEFNRVFEPGDRTATFSSTLLSETTPGSSFCPNSSKIGTAKLKTPLLEHELEGSVYLASQNENPFGSLVAMYMAIEDPASGTMVKIPFEVRLCEGAGEVINGVSCEGPGQIITTAHNTPELPFEDLELHFFGGERAPLTTPPHCGIYTTQAVFTPWDGNGPVNTTASFKVEHGPDGGPCPGASLPFSPVLAGGSTNINAGAFSPLTTTISRADGEQSLQSVQLHMPAGLEGLLSNVQLCPEAQANEGTCGPESLIGETTVSAGVGSDPVSVKGGRVYLTETYAGAPFGLSIVNPVKAGPFDLEHDTANPNNQPPCDCVVVRARIEVDPRTAELTITTDKQGPHAIPHLIDGVPVQIKAVNVTINRQNFTFNPTNCDPMSLTGSIGSDENATSAVSIPFQATNCAVLKFNPAVTVSTAGKASKANGASLHVKISYPAGAMGTQAWFSEAKLSLPKQLPARLGTIQRACLAATFETNRTACPPASKIGTATVHTPVLPVPLTGPVYFVSYGGAKFPDAVLVLDGYGVHIELHGETFIDNKTGITSATFRDTPDVPFESIEVNLPTGPYSEFGANLPAKTNYNFCGQKLTIPTTFKAQNGLQTNQNTPITVTGCPKTKPLTRTQKLAAALKTCHKKHGTQRTTCEHAAHKKYGVKAAKTPKIKSRK